MYCAAPERRWAGGHPAGSGPRESHPFDYWWSLPGDWVEAPNRRREGWSGVVRAIVEGEEVYIKRQCNHLYRSLRHPLGRPTASREWLHLQRLASLGIPAPTPLFHGSRRTAEGMQAVLVTAALNGYRALDALDAQAAGPATERRAVAAAIGHTLGRLHRARLQHGCLYGKHVMIRFDAARIPQVALLDLEKMRRRLSSGQAARHDLAQLKRHQHYLTADDWQTLTDTHARTLAGA